MDICHFVWMIYGNFVDRNWNYGEWILEYFRYFGERHLNVVTFSIVYQRQYA